MSLGTGVAISSKYRIGPHFPKRERFFPRLISHFMDSLDGEKQWKRFIQPIPKPLRSRYHRLNVQLDGSEPALDDVASMGSLKQQTDASIAKNPPILARDTMIACIFYLEVDCITQLEGGSYQCQGTIYCRLPLTAHGRKKLCHALLEKHALFRLGRQTFACVQSQPKGDPIFRRSVSFIVGSMEEKLEIFVDSITEKPTPISGMPVDLRTLVNVQCLDIPFGSIDDRSKEKGLPNLPLKRKAPDI